MKEKWNIIIESLKVQPQKKQKNKKNKKKNSHLKYLIGYKILHLKHSIFYRLFCD